MHIVIHSFHLELIEGIHAYLQSQVNGFWTRCRAKVVNESIGQSTFQYFFHAKHSQLLKCENVMLFIFLYDSKLNMSFGVVVSEEITDWQIDKSRK